MARSLHCDKLDPLGRKIEEQSPDQWTSRSGVALALADLAPLLPQDQIRPLFDFFVPTALGDRSPEVRSHMRDAALATINSHGKVKTLNHPSVISPFLTERSVKGCTYSVVTSLNHCLNTTQTHWCFVADDVWMVNARRKVNSALKTESILFKLLTYDRIFSLQQM